MMLPEGGWRATAVAAALVLMMSAMARAEEPEPVTRVLIPHGLLEDEDRAKLQDALDDWREKVLLVTDWAIDRAQADAIEAERAHFEPIVAGLEAQVAALEAELAVVQREAEKAEADRWRLRINSVEAENAKLRRSKLVDGLVFTLGSAGAGYLAGALTNQCGR